MSDTLLPPGWVKKDIREIVPEVARKDVIAFCETLIKPGKPIDSIGQRARNALEKHQAAFEEMGVHLGFFGYLLEHQNNQGNIPKIIKALK